MLHCQLSPPKAHGSCDSSSVHKGKKNILSLDARTSQKYRKLVAMPRRSAFKNHRALYCLDQLEAASTAPQALPSSHRPSGKSFWKGRVRGGRTFFQKGFPPRKLFFLQLFRRLPAVPKTKNPRRSGDKKRPPRAESCKGVSNNLWQRPTFPHDVMQYHRRWRA